MSKCHRDNLALEHFNYNKKLAEQLTTCPAKALGNIVKHSETFDRTFSSEKPQYKPFPR